MKLKTKYAAGMRDELERLLGCPVEVVEDREAKYPCKMMTKQVRPKLSNSPMKTRSTFRRCAFRPGGRTADRVAVRADRNDVRQRLFSGIGRNRRGYAKAYASAMSMLGQLNGR